MITALMLLLGTAFYGCSSETTPTTDPDTSSATTIVETTELEPIVVPTMPSVIPGYLELDSATGLHMTGTPTVVDFAAYRLKVSGKVDKELSLTYDELRLMPKMMATPELVCERSFVDTATWSGVQLKMILEMAGMQSGATRIRMKSADGYSASLNLQEALAPENFLAYELEGQPLPVLHGFPLRAVFPGKTGFVWAKWLVEIVLE
jgi:DMSO/TMAO reductase YedYZ molybdopterin-dependent catalytic subunit